MESLSTRNAGGTVRLTMLPEPMQVLGVFAGEVVVCLRRGADGSQDSLVTCANAQILATYPLRGNVCAHVLVELNGKLRVLLILRHDGEPLSLVVVGPHGVERMRPLPPEVEGELAVTRAAAGVTLLCRQGLMYIHLGSGLVRWLTRLPVETFFADREWVFANDSSHCYGIHVPSGRQVRWRESGVFCRGVLSQSDGRLLTMMVPGDAEERASVLVHDSQTGDELTSCRAPVGAEVLYRAGPKQAVSRSIGGAGHILDLDTIEFRSLGEGCRWLDVGGNVPALLRPGGRVTYAGRQWWINRLDGQFLVCAGEFYRVNGRQVVLLAAGEQQQQLLGSLGAFVNALALGKVAEAVDLLSVDLRLWSALTPHELAAIEVDTPVHRRGLLAEISAHRSHYTWLADSCPVCTRPTQISVFPRGVIRCLSCGATTPSERVIAGFD